MVTKSAVTCLGFLKPSLVGMRTLIGKPYLRGSVSPANCSDICVCGCSAGGMSDGATYALLCGLRDGTPFTNLAPACGVLHPMLLASGDLARAQGRPIYLVHGALDWMFPVATAHLAREALTLAGAALVYRELADLSHTYPRDENPAILTWLLA